MIAQQTMDVLNKFYSTVSSTVSQLSSVLPGNPLTREYEVTNQIASAGPGLLWKIYSGFKKSTKQPASIFVFEKRLVVPQDRDQVLETLRRGVTQLTKLRHPQVLVVQHPLEESRDCLAFATEPVFASLANILGRNENLSTTEHLNSYSLYDVEIKYGLMQLGEGLSFLHKDAKILHHNVCPASIIVNEQGAWKLFGFDFSVHNTSTDSTPHWPWTDYRKCGNELCQPELDYFAPECGVSDVNSAASDIYSFGMLICSVFNNGKPLLPHSSDWFSYQNNISKLKTVSPGKLQFVVESLRQLVRMMVNTTPELRPDVHEFLKCSYFEDVGVKALNYLDSLFHWDNRQKAQFYKGLPQIIEKLPQRVCLHRIVPCLVKEFVNPMMVPFVLPNVFIISEKCSKQEFSNHVLPHLKPVMSLQEPIQILLIFMQRMETLLKLTSADEVKNDVLPLLYRSLECDSTEIQELCLSILPSSASLIESTAMKNALLPRIKRLCVSTSSLSVRVNCLICVSKLLDHLDKWLVLDDILPFLPQIPSKEPAVIMAILGLYKMVLNHKKMGISKEMIATKVIPFLMPLCIENSLSLSQFGAIMSIIKDLVNRVETQQRVKLEQLHSIKEEQKDLESSMNGLAISKSSPGMKELEELFGIQSKPEPPSQPSLKNLTFEEKERMVAEGEAARRMMATPTLKPAPSAPQTKPFNQPKDLTANLIGKNMMSLSQSSKSGQSGMGRKEVTTGGGAMKLGMGGGQQRMDPPQWNWSTPQINSTNPTALTMSRPAYSQLSSQPTVQGDGWPPWALSTPQSLRPSESTATKTLSPSEINDLLS